MAENNRPHVGYEESDVNVFAVGKFAVALVLVTVCILALLAGVFRFLQSQEGGVAKSVDPVRVFPQPQLQKAEIEDLQTMRAAEDQVLNGYGMVDPAKGVVRIPIARAMDLLVQRGLPAREAQPDGLLAGETK